ncbi:MAG: FAD binding domain-containing protein [Acidobacteria bacterium]|nr:FAD binding domain-containing protein [Acidobacteriota bacterium]
MIKFILNDNYIETDLPAGATVLDFVRYHKNLKGTKIGCREGDCGACTILVGEILTGGSVKYRTQTSCLMPLANARGKHVVTVEGINKSDGELTEVQQALVDENGTQCGFCTVGFVMSLTGFCLDDTVKTQESAISSIDGNICRCTGYKSIERAAARLTQALNSKNGQSQIDFAVEKGIVPDYFSGIKNRLEAIKDARKSEFSETENQSQMHEAKHGVENQYTSEGSKLKIETGKSFVGGGTDLYVQRPEEMVYASTANLFDASELRFIEENGDFIELGAATVVTDLLASPIFQRLFPNLYKHLKLVSSTPIRNMATLAGNFVNASPIGDMTAWFLALDASIVFNTHREIALRELYLGYKTLAKTDYEFITKIRFGKNFSHFNFEKVSKRTFLDISSVNTAISLKVENDLITEAHVSAGGVAPVPLYLEKTSRFLRGKEISGETISAANEIIQSEINPISDVRGSQEYKRLLLRQLFTAHFAELFEIVSE